MLMPPQSDYSNPETLASWVELCALANPDGFAARGNVLELLRDYPLFDDGYSADTIETDSLRTSVGVLGDVWRTLGRRFNLLGVASPLVIEEHKVRRRVGFESQSSVAAYTAMLLIEAAASKWYPDLSIVSGDPIRRWFEEIVVAALPRLLGGKASRFGVPFPDDWPKPFRDRVRHLASLFDLDARPAEINQFASASQQDDSLDVVARCRIADEEVSSPILLFQCATGANWLASKKGEPTMRLWGRYINWNGPQFRALAVPFTLRRRGALLRASESHEAIIFDRIRLSRGRPDRFIDCELRRNLSEWCEAKFKFIRSGESSSEPSAALPLRHKRSKLARNRKATDQ